MNKRIRYVCEDKLYPHIVKSKQAFTIGDGAQVKVAVNKETFKFEIVNAANNELIEAGGNTDNYIVLLRQAKTALKRLGVALDTEERNRNYGPPKKEVENESGTV